MSRLELSIAVCLLAWTPAIVTAVVVIVDRCVVR